MENRSITQILETPATFAGQTVAVRGFLYQSADGRWILASQPGLKSCCVGTEVRSTEQLQVIGDMPTHAIAGMARVVTGRLEGHASTGFSLHDASVTDSPSLVGYGWILLALAAVCYLIRRVRGCLQNPIG